MYSAVIRRAARLRTALLALGTLLSPAALALDNGDFSELRVEYADRQALPGWTPILTDEGARPDARLVVEAVDFAYAGVAGESGRRGNVAYFDTLTDGFGVNKLDQCVAFDRSQPLTINVPLRTNAPISNDLRARVNPGFYADMASCEADIQADSTDGRLSGSNLDWDVRFATAGAASNEWLDFEATHGDKKGPILYAANSTPADAAVVRISLRARDDSAAPDRRIYFGAVEVSNGAAEIEVANARFDRLQVLPGQYLVEDGQQQGWRVVAGDLRVEQHPPGFAATGVNVLRYGELMEGFGDSRLDQCVELPQFHDFGVSLQARSDSPHKDLRVRVAVAWFADANCINELDELDDEDFQIKGAANANTWQLVETNRTALADIPVDATHARISLRARDRTGMTPAPMLYLDAVRLRGVLAVSPAGGSYSAEELPTVHLDTAKSEPLEAGWTLHYTLTPEPTDPTLSSAELTAEGVEIDSSGWLSLAVFDKDGSQVGGITRTYYQILVGEPPEFVGLGDAVAGVVGDSSDPVATQGLSFELADVESDAAALQLSLTSSNPDVVPDANLQVERDENQVVLRIVPEGVGFSDIQLALEDEHGNVTTHTLHYAASAHPQPDTTHTRWYTGRADLSTAVSLDDDFMLVFDDEGDYERSPPLANGVLVFDLSRSGAPVADLSAVVDAELDLANSDNCELDGMTGIAARCSTDGEVDYEAAVRLNDRIYVTGSHSNNRNGRARPDRWRFFAADVAGSGASTSLEVQGFYRWLREDLRSWDAANGHGLGADHFGLVASSNAGDEAADPDLNQAPESPNLNGFSIEGLTLSPDDDAVWFGFRAPLVAGPDGPAVLDNNSALGRTHALIVAVTNYDDLATAASGGSPGDAVFGAPIRLDLGGRGIREIRRDANSQYLIIAGPPDGATGAAPKDFRLFVWDGSHEDGFATNLVLRGESLTTFTQPNFAGSPEGIARLPDDLLAGGALDIVSDNGDVDFYASGIAAKDLAHNEHKKFRVDRLMLAATGRCGNIHGTELDSAPAPEALCASGTPGTLYGSDHGPWQWSCESGRPELGTAFCDAFLATPAPVGSSPTVPPATEWDQLPDRFDSGIPDYVQSLVPSPNGETRGDGNGDNIPDYLQNNVVSLPSGTQNGYVTIVSTGDYPLRNVRAMASAPAGLPEPGAGIVMPFGLFGFDVTGITPGGSEVITVHLQRDPRINGWVKWNHESKRWVNIAQSIIHEDSKTVVTFTLRDGDEYDADRAANGTIQDPGGPAIFGGTAGSGGPKSIPVLAPWMMPVLALLMMLAGMRARRQR